MKSVIDINSIIMAYRNKGYKLYENDQKEYNVNIFGVRASVS